MTTKRKPQRGRCQHPLKSQQQCPHSLHKQQLTRSLNFKNLNLVKSIVKYYFHNYLLLLR
ncbi:hypothetical protein EVA_07687 [gut metagenome]|uniref:Uncharacterized protein n=1 Tax=gut metagenome TaxID=749906 RepID=J9GUQ6_9ZZZZ